MVRAIADSDDDGDVLDGEDDLKSPDSARNAPAANSRSTKSTGSTERLQRDIQKAQRDLMAPGSSTKRSLEEIVRPSANPESPVTRAKRRKTSVDFIEQSPLRASQRRKSMATYGQSKRRMDGQTELSSSAFRALQELDDEQPLNDLIAVDDGTIAVDADFADFAEPFTGDGVELRDDDGVGEGVMQFGFPSTIADDFAAHEPFAMFPSVSSTVPNNTMSQHRMIAAALAANAPVTFASMREEQPPAQNSHHSSPNFSQFLTIGSPDKSSKSNPESSAKDAPKILPNLSPSLLGPFNETTTLRGTPKAKRSRSVKATTASAEQLTSSRTRRTKTQKDANDEGPTQESLVDELSMSTKKAAAPKETTLSELKTDVTPTQKPARRKSTKSTQRTHDEPVDELNAEEVATSLPKEQDNAKPSRSKSSRTQELQHQADVTQKKQANPSSDFLNSDDIAAIGLPKEQYKPRPSRRRSKAVEEEPIDYSVLPEKAAKAKAKRSKTVGAGLGRVLLSEAEKLERMQEMGFDSSQAKIALTNNSGNLERSIEWLSSRPRPGTQDSMNSVIGMDVSKKPKQKAERQPSRKETKSLKTKGESTKTQPQNGESDQPKLPSKPADPPLSPDKANGISIEIPPLKEPIFTSSGSRSVEPKSNNDQLNMETSEGSSPTLNRKRRGSTHVGDADSTQNEAAALETVVDKPVEPSKKRGRGRPKSTQKAQAPPTTVIEIHRDKTPALTGKDMDLARATQSFAALAAVTTALQEVDANKRTSNEVPSSTPPGQRKTSVPPVQTPKKATEPSPQHSPLSKGKVPYRVGLSRRARIPSLLRIVKK